MKGLITKTDIRKSKSSVDIMYKTNQTGQLSENCAIFDEVIPGVSFNLSIIKKGKIVDNSNFDVLNWYRTHKMVDELFDHVMEHLMGLKEIIDNVGNLINCTDKFVRVFTMDPIKGEDSEIISYFITATFDTDKFLNKKW